MQIQEKSMVSVVGGCHRMQADGRERCPVCRMQMTSIQACHLRCLNCGAELDCSDKGILW